MKISGLVIYSEISREKQVRGAEWTTDIDLPQAIDRCSRGIERLIPRRNTDRSRLQPQGTRGGITNQIVQSMKEGGGITRGRKATGSGNPRADGPNSSKEMHIHSQLPMSDRRVVYAALASTVCERRGMMRAHLLWRV